MRLNSRSDLAGLSELFSFVPPSLLALATEFGQGEALVAGKLVPSPTLGTDRATLVPGRRRRPAVRLGRVPLSAVVARVTWLGHSTS